MVVNMPSRLLCSYVVALIVMSSAGCIFNVPERFRESVEDPGSDFESQTGLAWPDNAEILSVDDTHGGFHGDGEFHVVFKTDPKTIQEYLDGPAPFGGSWRKAPVPSEIGSYCVCSSETISGSDEIHFFAEERGPESMRWHNGLLLVVDPSTNKVCLSVWDF